MTFVLNAIDVLAGELDYPKVRRHVPDHRTLRLVERNADEYRREAAKSVMSIATRSPNNSKKRGREDESRIGAEAEVGGTATQRFNRSVQTRRIDCDDSAIPVASTTAATSIGRQARTDATRTRSQYREGTSQGRQDDLEDSE